MSQRVRAAVFSFTPPAPAHDDGSYLRWHLLDHMPEQYQLPGIVLGQRWIADGDYLDARLAGQGPLADIGNVVNYLFTEPVLKTYDEFMALGRRLAKLGRFPEVRKSLAVKLLHLQAAHATLVSPEVLPFRPHRGVFLLVEDGRPTDLAVLLGADGVAGLWAYAADDMGATVVYLDRDPIETTRAIAPLVDTRRALFAGPLRSMVEWEAWPPRA